MAPKITLLVKSSLLGIAAFATFAETAQAKEASTSDDGTAASEGEIIVTAQKKAQSSQDVPAAVSAVSQDAMANGGVSDQSQLTKLVPGLQVGSQSTSGFAFIRGVGQSLTLPNIQPSVSVNMNGVYLPRDAGATPLFDMARVEVLPGPQGTLWGRNAAGGAINFVTQRPTQDFDGYVTAEVGNYSATHVTAAINVPLADGVAFRVAGDRNKHDAWCACGLGDYGNSAIRGSLLIAPSSRWSLDVLGQYVRHSDRSGLTFVYDHNNPPSDFYNPPTSMRIPDNLIPLLHEDTKLYIAQAEFNYHFSDHLTLTVLPAYVEFKADNVIDFLGANAAGFGNHAKQKSLETRLSQSGKSLEFVLGAYVDSASTIVPVTPNGFPMPMLIFSNNTNSYAFFGEVTYRITDKLRLTGGLRYSNDKFSGFAIDGFGFPGITASRSNRNSNVDWKGRIEYKPSKDNMLYATVQTGYVMGGFEANSTASLINPEKLTAYTLGTKNKFFDRRLTLNAELFYYDYKNYHLQSSSGVYPASFLITSQTPAIVKGLDLSASLRVGGNDQISVSALIQSAEIRTSTLIAPNGTPAGQSMNGFSLPNAPYETISGSWEHTIPLNSGAAIVSDIQAYYNSGYYQEPTHNPNTQQKAYTLIDINLTYKCPIRKFVMHSSTLQFCA